MWACGKVANLPENESELIVSYFKSYCLASQLVECKDEDVYVHLCVYLYEYVYI
jgi:hypothetical protein